MHDEVFCYITREERRQTEGIELIPSENYVSESVLKATGSVLTNKYSEGYPGKRYYGGQENIDAIEQLAIDRAKKLFRADHANVQPHSGANANEAVYFAWCDPGDRILAMDLAAGGHLTHGAPVTRSARTYQFSNYGVTESGDIDYDQLESLALELKPRIILVGYSAFMKIPDFARIIKLAKKLPDCLFVADMAHIAGLIAAGVHPNPLDHGFHVMATTTHKTLRGPRGGLILSRGIVSTPLKHPPRTLENIPTLIDRAVFPGTQGGPLEHIIAAKAVAFEEALRPEFHTYATQILKNAKTLAHALTKRGFILQGGGTENHLILVDLKSSFNLDGKTYERALDRINITLNANAIPSDKTGTFTPSGVRLGTPAVTTRGMKESEMTQIAGWMHQVAKALKHDEFTDALVASLRTEIRRLATNFPIPGVKNLCYNDIGS